MKVKKNWRRWTARIGSGTPLEGDGGFIKLVKQPGIEPWFEVEWFLMNDVPGVGTGKLYRFEVVPSVFTEHDWVKIAELAKATGIRAARLGEMAVGTVNERAAVLVLIGENTHEWGGYNGFDNLDGYPLEMTCTELRRRWKTPLGKDWSK